MKKTKGKKGISPVIATVLLISMVIVIALIIFLWVREIGGETITKFGGQNIETVCGDVEFQASASATSIAVSNTGIVPIFNFKVKVDRAGSFQTINLNEESGWPDTGLGSGASFDSGVLSALSGASKVTITPVLMGESNSGLKTFVCKESVYGEEILL